MKKSYKRSLVFAAIVIVLGGVWGFTALKGAASNTDPSKIATVERGTMVRSVVATGKVEPITKVEIKSQGERHHREASRGRRPGRGARPGPRRAG